MTATSIKFCFAGTTAFGGIIYPDDDLVADILRAKGHSVDYIPWDAPGETWDRHDVYINRCTWRYQEKYAAFAVWLKEMHSSGKVFHNSAAIQLWSTNKRYLQEFEQRGLPCVPSLFSQKSDLSDIKTQLDQKGWHEIVCKPAIGAGGFDVIRCKASDTGKHRGDFENLLTQYPDQAIIVQPFLPEVIAEGEWSFIFFNGAFSHVMLKTPGADEFRIQSRLGGTSRKVDASEAKVSAAKRCLEIFDKAPLYARIDGFFRNGEFMLAECEVCEPYLWLADAPGAAEKFADALLDRVGA